MPRYQYAGVPALPPTLQVATIAGNTSPAIAGSKSLWLQTQNRAGFSLVSLRTDITLTAGQGLSVTVPAGALPNPSGVDVRSYKILLAETADPNDGVIVAAADGYDGDGETPLSPPFTILLTEDEHFNIASLIVADAAALPDGSDRINGQRRSVENLAGLIVEWSETSSAWLAAVPQDFSTAISDLEASGGANRSLGVLSPEEVIFPEYGLSGFSEQVRYWLVNNDSSAIPSGRGIAVNVFADVQGEDTDLSLLPGILGGLELQFLGYVDAISGVLDTTGAGGSGTMPGLNAPITYTDPATVLSTPKPLPPGAAYLLGIRLNTDVVSLNNLLPDGTLLRFTPSFFRESATVNPAAQLTGSIILGDFDKRRLVPTLGLDAIALNGSGLIQVPTGSGFSFANVGEQTVTNLEPDTSGQLVAINFAGDCTVVDEAPTFGALRCIVGTSDGIGAPTSWSDPVTLSNATYLRVGVNYPDAIRADYDDPIAGSEAGTFNASTVRIYVRPIGGGNILFFDQPITPNDPDDSFLVGASPGTDLGTAIAPIPASPRFGLYQVADDGVTVTAEAGSSTFVSGDYEVAIALIYSNTITSLDHRVSSGCIPEGQGNLAGVFQLLSFFGAPVADIPALRILNRTELEPGQLVVVLDALGQTRPYHWDAIATGPDDGLRVIALADGEAGRFRLTGADPDIQMQIVDGAVGEGELALTEASGEVTEVAIAAIDRSGANLTQAISALEPGFGIELTTGIGQQLFLQVDGDVALAGGVFTVPVEEVARVGIIEEDAIATLRLQFAGGGGGGDALIDPTIPSTATPERRGQIGYDESIGLGYVGLEAGQSGAWGAIAPTPDRILTENGTILIDDITGKVLWE